MPDPAANLYINKAHIRDVIRVEGIPYTFVSCNYFVGILLPQLAQPELEAPPRDNILIFGDGNKKAVFVKEEDVASFTIKTVDDLRTLNKVMYMRPPGNTYSMNELVALWEERIGKNLKKFYVSEEQVLQCIRGMEEKHALPAN
ncbi:hypothetical protein AMTR_s00018p00143990 [Amborella trichopoda]|uniref:NmrA-like domain-containing protein n=1 Tax=Amborella trichopoda TaxID=13333 RepID=W1PM08_AMBTC|nr:hypothetical protein AMTR_s00018p00143990 [Amborella trichopoda]